MNKKGTILLLVLLVLFGGCKSKADKKEKKSKKEKTQKIPGLKTMQKYGKQLSPTAVLNLVGKAMKNVTGGGIAYSIYHTVLNSPNDQKVFVIEHIDYNDQGLATNIEGHVEIPETYIEYVAKGGLGIPVYEAVEPNEFGVIFGRPGDLAVREGVVVKASPFEREKIYYIQLKAETYDKILRANVLFQAYEIAREPYLQNMILELQGMLLNSSSKDVIIQGIKEFKEEHPELNETEVMVQFLEANQSYLDELEQLDKDAKKRIKEGKKLINAIASGCALQTVGLVEHFTDMTIEMANIITSTATLDFGPLTSYIARNVPKNSDMKMDDLKQVRLYSNYQFDRYRENNKENRALFKKAMDLVDKIK